MFDDFGTPLFGALAHHASSSLGDHHPCTRALVRAAETSQHADIAKAQKQLSELPPREVVELMEAAHKALRESPAALLGSWAAPGDPKHKN